ncbi:hypothetical protein PBRA_008655 [Plasmodiophora brassicae]|uniref:Glycoside-hydrolase family GH114 TIM-barrel domain-containing protein n=1 Tax=Plasmodiophora brassicae TaxID=37360 RepID=A0A0G4J267_PLABS|nr:hypothetical protein PBRA_008655 [Plasmodiophora brassicae]
MSALVAVSAAAFLFGMANVDATWTVPQWELAFNSIPNVAKPNVPVWDIDPEQLDSTDIPTLMNALRANNRYIICYVNVGSLDSGVADANSFTAVKPTIIGNPYPGWPGEFFLDTRRDETRALVKARFQRMASYGCHAIEPDNLDTYTENTFQPSKPNLTIADALDYMDWISTTVHDLGMAIGLKNGGPLVTPYNLVSKFDFAIVESCAEFPGTCAQYDPFIQAGKPVFAAEYTTAGSGGCPIVASVASACAATNAANFEGIVKSCNLGTEYQSCQTYNSNGAASELADAAAVPNASKLAHSASDAIPNASKLADPASDAFPDTGKLADTAPSTKPNASQHASAASVANPSTASDTDPRAGNRSDTTGGSFANDVRSSG